MLLKGLRGGERKRGRRKKSSIISLTCFRSVKRGGTHRGGEREEKKKKKGCFSEFFDQLGPRKEEHRKRKKKERVGKKKRGRIDLCSVRRRPKQGQEKKGNVLLFHPLLQRTKGRSGGGGSFLTFVGKNK